MRYFTKELWASWQKGDFRDGKKAWDGVLADYRAQLAAVAPRLGEGASFFTDHSLHDGALLRLSLSDWPAENLAAKGAMINRTGAELVVLAAEKVYRLRYEGVAGFLIDGRNDLFGLPESRFGDWGYDELVAEGAELFRHSILFQTGTEVSLVFRGFSFAHEPSGDAALRRAFGL